MEPQSDVIRDKKDLINKQQKDKQFRTAGQIKDIFNQPQDLFNAAEKYKKTFKIVKNDHPIHKAITIIDISLNARGPEEDQVYLNQPFYRNNIRRGNTLIFYEKQKKTQFARKGLIKFFDITMKSLKAIKQENLMILKEKDQSTHYAVFKQIENVLSCNEQLEYNDQAKVKIYRLNKANGQNAQISYNKTLGEWIICSKNVAIMLKNPNDLKFYKGQRYSFSILIAKAWFKIIQNLNKQQLQNLKNDCQGKTLIGQYCGNPDFQHLVKYLDITIYFYAITQLNSNYSCIPPNQAFSFFEMHHLPIVKNYQNSFVGEFTQFTKLGKKLMEVFKEVSKASIFAEQEGSVLYFVIEKPKVFCEYISDRYLQDTVPIPTNWSQKQIWTHVSSLGKLKTIEYRLLRKLREKLKYFSRLKPKQQTPQTKQQDFRKFQQKYASFEKQSYQLLKGQTLNKPIQYYFCAALLAMQYAFKHHKSSRSMATLNDYYLDFISVIFWCIENKQPITQALMKDQTLHEKLRAQTWENYNIDIVADYQNLLQRIVPKYAKIKKSNPYKFQQNQQEQQQEIEQEND